MWAEDHLTSPICVVLSLAIRMNIKSGLEGV